VAWAQTLFSERFPSEWTYAQGLLFIVVVGFFPAGLAGVGALFKRWRERKPTPSHEPKSVPGSDVEPDAEKVEARA
jgi:urea transport system permease protein